MQTCFLLLPGIGAGRACRELGGAGGGSLRARYGRHARPGAWRTVPRHGPQPAAERVAFPPRPAARLGRRGPVGRRARRPRASTRLLDPLLQVWVFLYRLVSFLGFQGFLTSVSFTHMFMSLQDFGTWSTGEQAC